MTLRVFVFSLLMLGFGLSCKAQKIIPGAHSIEEYLPMLRGKRVGLLINQTSRIGNALLVDTLPKRGVKVVKIFAPEHGFRGGADAGAHIASGRDKETGLPIISLYGKNKRPNAAHLADVDVVIYDIQDVGTRFYTYISSLQYMMEACAAAGKQLIVFDRPNPTGHFVDGPVLDTAFRSFVGMQPIPIVYGMTPGEYAMMLKGEGWAPGVEKLELKVVKLKGWDHKTRYSLPVPPSPNLRTDEAIALYPTLCLFEGSPVSVGRGTTRPFEQWGYPGGAERFKDSFMPVSTPGATHPPYEGEVCWGHSSTSEHLAAADTAIQLDWIVEMYQSYKGKEPFFNSFFNLLAGTDKLAKDIAAGRSAEVIRASWAPGIAAFKKVRKKYLLYPDFE